LCIPAGFTGDGSRAAFSHTGAIASDIHGKNHHKEGSLYNYILELELMLANGRIIKCSPELNTDLFKATCGGMGLTGFILSAAFKLKRIESSYISQATFKAKNIDVAFKLFEETKNSTYSVAWLDCLAKNNSLGRSILMTGEHIKIKDLLPKFLNQPLITSKKSSLTIPINLPGFILNNLSVKVFNYYYYRKASDKKQIAIHYEPFFYPLDKIQNWNRLYGRSGFCQYQFILPLKNSYEGLKEILIKISQKKLGSFLAVLKLYGKQDSLLSFPMEGFSAALDFPVTKKLFPLLDELDELVSKYSGRLYLTKDSRMNRDFFHSTYQGINEFIEIKKMYDPDNMFRSLQSMRLGIH